MLGYIYQNLSQKHFKGERSAYLKNIDIFYHLNKKSLFSEITVLKIQKTVIVEEYIVVTKQSKIQVTFTANDINSFLKMGCVCYLVKGDDHMTDPKQILFYQLVFFIEIIMF